MQNFSKKIPSWAKCDPWALSGKNQFISQNLVAGKWKGSKKYRELIDPMNGEIVVKQPDPKGEEVEEFYKSAKSCPKFGLHNYFYNPERFNMYGDICFRMAAELRKQENVDYFSKLIQRFMPKSWPQSIGETTIVRKFLENFGGDNARYTFKGFSVSGDHTGQMTNGYRWPYGPVAIVSPFNFPLEIPGLQMMGALLAGNKLTMKSNTKTSIVMEEFVRFAIACGMPPTDVDFLNCGHKEIEDIVKKDVFRVIQFTGSSGIAERLAKITKGKVRLEDAGFDWKLFGSDVDKKHIDYIAWQCDQDAYAATGQKCSAQSVCFIHSNWIKAGLLEKMQKQAARRKLEDLSIGPVLSWTNKQIKEHQDKLLQIPGAKLLFGGKPLQNTKIPECYGSYECTAVFVPLEQIDSHFDLVTTEVFGPFQVVTEWKDGQLDKVLEQLERLQLHLTAGIVSNDVNFINYVLGKTVNGVTYAGIRARTTGAPQNHWFGPAGDPRGAGIGTRESILHVWTCHREIINDVGPFPKNWKLPPPN